MKEFGLALLQGTSELPKPTLVLLRKRLELLQETAHSPAHHHHLHVAT